MENDNLISKKDLLIETGISYGQLYRWKRENLIPESWFIKQSSFTGQETFFPRDKILKRIAAILELKDAYSLEELAHMLSPELTNRTFSSDELSSLKEIDQSILKIFEEIFEKRYFTFIELMFIYIASEIKAEFKMEDKEIEYIIRTIKIWTPKMKGSAYSYMLCQRETQRFSVLLQQDALILMDAETKILKTFSLDELSRDLNLKFNGLLKGVGGI